VQRETPGNRKLTEKTLDRWGKVQPNKGSICILQGKGSTLKESVALDAGQFLDEDRLSTFQVLVASVCGGIAFMDGYDVQSMGFVAPALSAALHIPRAALGPLLSSGLIGMMAGALLFGTLADRFGRKRVLVTCTLIFGVMSLITATASSIQTFAIYRLITGLGLGGAMPNAIALTAESTPKKYRSTVVTLMFCGFSIGAAVGGFVAAGLIARYGWQAVFLIGGLVPITIAALATPILPESMLTAARSRASASRRRAEEHVPHGLSVKELFKDGRVIATPLLWICFFMNLLVLFFLTNWLPILMHDSGIKVETAIMITTLFQIAGTVGAIFLGWIFDRGFSFGTLALAYFGAALSVILIGQSGASIGLLMATVTAAGFCVVGGQTSSHALVAGFYPTSVRATGLGWCLGLGRVGSIVGPILGGALLTLGYPAGRIFWVVAIPALIAAIASCSVAIVDPRRTISGEHQ
jgi:AAHS family 4-hydroxybenzoate transporter-like MFS transporter